VLKLNHAKRNNVKQDLPLLYNFCQSFCVCVEFTSLLELVCIMNLLPFWARAGFSDSNILLVKQVVVKFKRGAACCLKQ
jgi:hypothetical protein